MPTNANPPSEVERPPVVSIIIPTLNEQHSIGHTLDTVEHLFGGHRMEVIIVDGGSTDGTLEFLRGRSAHITTITTTTADPGRGTQMHAGAGVAQGEALWFLHADTLPPAEAITAIITALQHNSRVVGGNFSVLFDGHRRSARFLTWLYPQLRKLGLCYGDSAIFVRAAAYKQIGGFKPFPIFEDLDLVRRLKRLGHIVHLPLTVVTSSRRFEDRSFAVTFARWAALQVLYWLGVNPCTLGRLYRHIRSTPGKS